MNIGGNQFFCQPASPSRKCLRTGTLYFFALWLGAAGNLLAETTNSLATGAPPLPDAGASFLRVMGSLALVLGIFLGGVWLLKNWQRVARQHGHKPRLDILESRPLGGRQAVHVIGYDRQRFLVAVSPAGISLLSHLPDADVDETAPAGKTPAPVSFAQALTQVLKGK